MCLFLVMTPWLINARPPAAAAGAHQKQRPFAPEVSRGRYGVPVFIAPQAKGIAEVTLNLGAAVLHERQLHRHHNIRDCQHQSNATSLKTQSS